MNTILVAGAIGYLGKFLAIELLKRGYRVRAVVRNSSRFEIENANGLEIYRAEVTAPNTLTGSCEDVQTVISTVGITRQKDGLSYLDVDYQANLNLLKEAQRILTEEEIFVKRIGRPHNHIVVYW